MKTNLKKLIAMGLTAVMAVSVMSVSAFAVEDNEVIYTYIQDGQEVNITQADLDAGHWDKDALGDTAPVIYENFPMSITEYSNDVAELYLDIVYMKKISDMTSVHLEILDLSDENIIYDADLTENSFYSPEIVMGDSYKATLTETIDGETTVYERGIATYEGEADMPEYVTNATSEDENTIMIADVETLRAGRNTDGNNISVDMSVADYERVKANEFKEYCSTLPQNKVYRIYTVCDGKVYAGYFNSNNIDRIYNMQISSCSWDTFYSPSAISAPTYTLSDVKNNAIEGRYTEYSATLRETSNTRKYIAYYIDMPQEFIQTQNAPVFRAVARSNSPLVMKAWYTVGAVTSSTTLKTAGVGKKGSNNTTVYTMDANAQGITSPNPNNYIRYYFMVYLTTETTDTVSLSFEPVSNYNDDVTGSVFDAFYGESSYTELPNTEFNLTDSWDVDVFYIDYQGTVNKTYKVELRNRSLEDQTKLENGTSEAIKGSHAKYIVLSYFTDKGNAILSEEYAVYEVPKNADLSVYNQLNENKHTNIISIYDQQFTNIKGEKYQLSFTRYPN